MSLSLRGDCGHGIRGARQDRGEQAALTRRRCCLLSDWAGDDGPSRATQQYEADLLAHLHQHSHRHLRPLSGIQSAVPQEPHVLQSHAMSHGGKP